MSQLIFEGKQRDLADLFSRGHELASSLSRDRGLHPGSCILLALEFSEAAVELLIASWILKTRCVMLPPTCSVALFRSVTETFSPHAVCVDALNERLLSCLEGEPSQIGDDEAKKIFVFTSSNSAREKGPAASEPLQEGPPTDIASLVKSQPEVVFFTSGSTSQAKGVVLDWGLILKKGEAVLAHYEAGENDRVMPVLPFSHVYGLYPLMAAFSTGVDCLICRETVAPGEIALAISRDEATIVICPPLTAQFLFGRHAPSEAVQNKLRVVAMGGAAMPKEVLEAVCKHLPSTQVFLSYGLAETYSTICCLDVSAEPESFASVGPSRFLAKVEARDPESGDSVATGEIGELCIGGQITSGYYGTEHPREIYFTADRWLRTGDLGTVDERGYVQIRGRLKETINAGGLSIDPSEIEEILVSHAAVQDCGVFGHVRSNREFPIAAVVLDPAATAEQEDAAVIEELFAHCRKQLSSKLMPGKIVPIDVIPRGALGKIERANLKKSVLQE